MKYLKEGGFYTLEESTRIAYVVSRNMGFGFSDNKLGIAYDDTHYLSMNLMLHNKEIKRAIRHMWKITIRGKRGARWSGDDE